MEGEPLPVTSFREGRFFTFNEAHQRVTIQCSKTPPTHLATKNFIRSKVTTLRTFSRMKQPREFNL